MIEYSILSLAIGIIILIFILRAAGVRKLSDIETDKGMLQILGLGILTFGVIAGFFLYAFGDSPKFNETSEEFESGPMGRCFLEFKDGGKYVTIELMTNSECFDMIHKERDANPEVTGGGWEPKGGWK